VSRFGRPRFISVHIQAGGDRLELELDGTPELIARGRSWRIEQIYAVLPPGDSRDIRRGAPPGPPGGAMLDHR
jgi:hypothetical protein